MLTATRTAYADPDALTGGWDIRIDSGQPPRDLRSELDAAGVVDPALFSTIAQASPLRIDAIQTDGASVGRWQNVNLTVVDDAFTSGVRTPLTGGDQSAWTRLTRPGTAVVGAGLLKAVPNRLRVQASEGRDFRPVVLWLRDTRERRPAVRVEVVAIADGRGPFGNSVIVGASTLAGWAPAERAAYVLSVVPGVNPREVAAGLSLSAADLRARTLGDELRLVQGVRGLLSMILQGFMGIGLLAGVAALGTLATRAVVERRRQIGVLRALGFTARHVSLGLLIESAVIALLGAGLGVGIGLFVAQSTVVFLSRQSPELQFAIPWLDLAGIVLLALGAALLMTLLPARQAARLTPAEALREA
jgi:putative ABC transport system permease protein